MSEYRSLNTVVLAQSAWEDFRRSHIPLVVYSIVIKVVEAWLVVPIVAAGLAVVLSLSGHQAVSNWDALHFLLSPLGILFAVFLGVLTVGLFLFELAGTMNLVTLTESTKCPTWNQYIASSIPSPWQIGKLGAVILTLLSLAAVPFIALALLSYRLFLFQQDINYYVTERPLNFWLAAGCGLFLILAALSVGAWLCVRWSLALAILVYERKSPLHAMRASRERVRGIGGKVACVLLGWVLGVFFIGAAIESGFQLFAVGVLSRAGEQPIVPILMLLAAQTVLVAVLSFILNTGLGLLTRRLYLCRDLGGGVTVPAQIPSEETPSPAKRFSSGIVCLVLLVTPLLVWNRLSAMGSERPPLRVTAHRGHSVAAPENTISAVEKAIESGADYAEIDVLLTADGVAVLLHDSDLKRVAGDERRIAEVTFAELQKLDVGGWFSAEFAGERVPRLAEVLQLCQGKIKLNIELKIYDPDPRLVPEIVKLIQESNFEAYCIVTTFKYDALLELKRLNPRLKTGLIVAHALGDISRLDVDLFSVRANWLTDDVIRAAHRQGKEIHVWTVNEAAEMYRLIKRGVNNIITDDPDLLIRVRRDWNNLTGAERLVLASRLLLGVDP